MDKVEVTEADRAEAIMQRMGYPVSEQGYYVTLLRAEILRQVKELGLVSRSGGTWVPGNEALSFEQRAKAQLAFDWSIHNGYSYKVECLDPIIWRWTDWKTGERRMEIRWKYIPAACRDALRRLRLRAIRPFLPRNPYK